MCIWCQTHPAISTYVKTNIGNSDIECYCREIIKDISETFHLEKCKNMEELTLERINGMPEDMLQFIQPGLSEELDDLLKIRIEGQRKLEGAASALASQIAKIEKKKSSKSYSYVKIHTMAKTEPILQATKRRAVLLKNQLTNTKKIPFEFVDSNETVQQCILDTSCLNYKPVGSSKKDVEITSPELSMWASQSYEASDKLARAILNFYCKYVTLFPSKYGKEIEEISRFVSLLDICHCKAKIAKKYNYCKPIIDENASKAFFSAKNLRHPLIEHLQQKELYVTNDVELGNTLDGMLLYGTNAVGKTSLIRAIGISVIMAQAGLYVPCSEFTYSPYKSIFTRILGNDDLFKGLSTFAVEMSELRTILRNADKNSLILGDELCSGTESDSALSIFTAGIETLHERKATFLFATHFHEIQHYTEIQALTRMCSKHMAVLYDQQAKMLLYDRKLRDGPGDAMYGLEVCKSLSLSDTFLFRAHEIRAKYNKHSDTMLNATTSHFNSKKIKGSCEICGNKGEEVHHLQHQQRANSHKYINNSFHKNHLANLINICKTCHDTLHKTDKQHRVVKTSVGYKICAI